MALVVRQFLLRLEQTIDDMNDFHEEISGSLRRVFDEIFSNVGK